MCDALLDTSRPTTPLPEHSRILRRTTSHASIDTVQPQTPKKKKTGVRRRAEDTTQNLKHNSVKRKKKHSLTQDVLENAVRDVALDQKTSAESKCGRKAAPPLRDASHRSEEKRVLPIADRLHDGVLFGLNSLLTFSGYKADSLTDVPTFKEEEVWEGCSLPVRILQLGPHVTTGCQDTTESSQDSCVGIDDVRLNIQPSETSMTIWDGLEAAHHVFKCRLVLRCTTHPYNSVSLPDIRHVEMDCTTCPVGSHYIRMPTLQVAYEGAELDQVTKPDVLPNVTLEAGIHMDKVWSKIQGDDTWGWYKDVFVPLSSRLFDKAEYREFKLVSRVWIGDGCIEDELTFGVSMLLRAVDMK